jgi:hypothetical protein
MKSGKPRYAAHSALIDHIGPSKLIMPSQLWIIAKFAKAMSGKNRVIDSRARNGMATTFAAHKKA